jgi:hypothetical protein
MVSGNGCAGAKFGVGPALVRAEGRPGGADYRLWRPGDGASFIASSITTSHMEFPKTNEGRRICQVIKVKPEALDEYKRVRSSRIPRRPWVGLTSGARRGVARGPGRAPQGTCRRYVSLSAGTQSRDAQSEITSPDVLPDRQASAI